MKSPFSKKSQHNEQVSLNITAMADIFTILLCFLLKSFFTGSMNVTPSKGIGLPNAKATSEEVEALKIEIFKKGVMVEDEIALEMKNYSIPKEAMRSDKVAGPLSKVFKKKRKKQKIIAQENSEVNINNQALVLADKKTPYQTIKIVLSSLAVNGFTDYKLVVAQN